MKKSAQKQPKRSKNGKEQTMTQNATVLAVHKDGRADISVRRMSSCGENCASCAANCANRDILATAVNSAGAEVGDTVVVESSTSKVLKIAMLVYLVPIVMLIAGYAVCAALGLGEGVCIAVSLAMMLVGTLAAKLANNAANKNQDLVYDIVRIIDN